MSAFSTTWLRLIVLVLLGFFLHACTAPPKMRLSRAEPVAPEKAVEPRALAAAKGDQVMEIEVEGHGRPGTGVFDPAPRLDPVGSRAAPVNARG